MNCYNCGSLNVKPTPDGVLATCNSCGVVWEIGAYEPNSNVEKVDWKVLVMLFTVTLGTVLVIVLVIFLFHVLSTIGVTPVEVHPWQTRL